MKRFLLIRIFTILSVPFILFSCHSGLTNKEPKSTPILLSSFAGEITIDTIHNKQVQNEILLTGKIAYNEDKVAKIFPYVGGAVELLKVQIGDYVHKGDVLAVIKSAETADYSNQLVTATSNVEITRKNLEMTKSMLNNGLVSEKDLLSAQKDLDKAESELRRIKEILSLYGDETARRYTIKAPLSGYVVERNATQNMVFRSDNQNSLFTISDLSEVWAIGNVYESDIPFVKEGYKAAVSTISYPDKVYEGKIVKAMNVIDSDTKVMKVRIQIPNPDILLKPEMFANIAVSYNENNKLPCVSSESIVFDKNKNFVMIPHSKSSVETREVKIYRVVGDKTYLLSGVKEGEQIITKNALIVYNALNN
jgi:membrane fusion protein, heavy metal efflux system